MTEVNVGIFGATGMVGKELIKVLFDRDFPIKNLKLYASPRSKGKKIDTPMGEITVQVADEADYSDLDIAFFAISSGWSKKNAEKATQEGCIVIDNSSAFRYDDEIPLIIPEINPQAIGNSNLIANPNCTTAIAAIPLYEIYKKYGLQKVFISTYQSASGAGNGGMEELEKETKNNLQGKEPQNKIFEYPLPFNVIPHIDSFQENDYTREEMKVVWETQKIFEDEDIPISCTCVRIPIMRVHSESIIVQTKDPADPQEIRDLMKNTKGVELKDNPDESVYPMPLTATEKYDVEVGRIRKNLVFGEKGIEFFVAGDQVLKGAALNAVQIGELVAKKRFNE